MDPRTEAINAEVSRQAAEAESRHAAICERLGPMSSSVWPYVVRPHVERQARERKAWARLLEVITAIAFEHAANNPDEARFQALDIDHALAKQALHDLGVDVDALLGEPTAEDKSDIWQSDAIPYCKVCHKTHGAARGEKMCGGPGSWIPDGGP